MIDASKARIESDRNFLVEQSGEIRYIENKVQSLVDVGMRSVYIDNDVDWVGEGVKQTDRLIQHFKELGFGVKVISAAGLPMDVWNNSCTGIEISW